MLPNEYAKLLKIKKPTLVMVQTERDNFIKFRIVRPKGLLSSWVSINTDLFRDGGMYQGDYALQKNDRLFDNESCFYRNTHNINKLVKAMNKYDSENGNFITIIGEV